MSMVKQKLTMKRKKEDLARRAVSFVNMADQFSCNIYLKINDVSYNGKSVISLMIAEFELGVEVEVTCEGKGEEEAMRSICEWFLSEETEEKK